MEIIVPEEFKSLYVVDGIEKIPSTILYEKADKITKFNQNLRTKSERMVELMLANNGMGIAAPQIGWGKRVMVIKRANSINQVLVNPELKEYEGTITMLEGCLSIPGLFGEVTRSSRITVKADDVEGESWEMNLKGWEAVVFQHELDHLNGILFYDRANPETIRWDQSKLNP